ncbi:hypothetical protein ANMWB30_02510 [Arthrobacter sp. MWB30]|nr:hypothetical protein ANMWB30_02510 [Arthrobacter sp. MWB30]
MVLTIVFIFVAARAVIGLGFELIDERGYGSPFSFEEWSLIILAPLLLTAVCVQSYYLAVRSKKDLR